MMPTWTSTTLLNAAADAQTALLNGGTLEVLAADSTLIGVFDLPSPAFDAAADGAVDLRAVPEATMIAKGQIVRGQIKAADGNIYLVMDAAKQEVGGAALLLTSDEMNVGDGLRIVSLTLQMLPGDMTLAPQA